MAAICNSFSGRCSFALLTRLPQLNKRAPAGGGRDSNSQPLDYKPNALVIDLYSLKPIAGQDRDSKMRVLVQTTTFQPLLSCANAVDEN